MANRNRTKKSGGKRSKQKSDKLYRSLLILGLLIACAYLGARLEEIGRASCRERV